MSATKARKPILTIDWDGVISEYPDGWQGATVITGGPVAGALAFLREAVNHFHVNIYSSRSGQEDGIAAMQKALRGWELHAEGTDTLVELLWWPINKPGAFLQIDDRAMQFTGIWPTMDSLLQFKTWQGK